MSVVVFPFIMMAIRRCRGGIHAVLALHVAGFGQPRIERGRPVRHGGGEVHGSHDRQSCTGKQVGFHFRPRQSREVDRKHDPASYGWRTAFGFPPRDLFIVEIRRKCRLAMITTLLPPSQALQTSSASRSSSSKPAAERRGFAGSPSSRCCERDPAGDAVFCCRPRERRER